MVHLLCKNKAELLTGSSPCRLWRRSPRLLANRQKALDVSIFTMNIIKKLHRLIVLWSLCYLFFSLYKFLSSFLIFSSSRGDNLIVDSIFACSFSRHWQSIQSSICSIISCCPWGHLPLQEAKTLYPQPTCFLTYFFQSHFISSPLSSVSLGLTLRVSGRKIYIK